VYSYAGRLEANQYLHPKMRSSSRFVGALAAAASCK
jgi:hypothetical protein